MGSMVERAQVTVKGVVQGVGFRPYVYTLARGLGLKGFVANTADGVLIDLEGEGLAEFLVRLRRNAPPLARITAISVDRHPPFGYREFSIMQSADADGAFTLVSPDVSLCSACRRELLDPADRRFLYPFINCTNCGPRYSITAAIPYDRPNTTMASFTMCPACSDEYHDPESRRFHAQPNACAACGPQVEFTARNSASRMKGREALAACIRMLSTGGIVAIKGLGGFHIACDARNEAAVLKLRERKRRSNKPFAVMAPDTEAVLRFCEAGSEERAELEAMRRPIVLLRKRSDTGPDQALSASVSPNNRSIGCMLPYTPLHELLFHHPADGNHPMRPNFSALVMTSGNLSEEPIVHTNEDALSKLSHLVDGYLLHDRDIFMRVDDSVIRVPYPRCTVQNGGSPANSGTSAVLFIRRSRGYAPDPIALRHDGPEVLACGADLKNTFTLTKGSFAVPSQHIGDMENYETLRFFEEVLENLSSVYRVDPVAIVHDLHPGYLSTRWACDAGSRTGGNKAVSDLPRYPVQHHYAHIGSVMAEHGLDAPVIGVAFDGTGYGTDGNLWGGEFLVAGIGGFERAGQLRYVRLPGGAASIREPWRTAVSCVMDAAGKRASEILVRAGFVERYGEALISQVMQIAASRELSPLASGAGRLFDAVSALIAVCDRNTFEGEAAMALEAMVLEGIDEEYPIELRTENDYTVLDFSPMFLSITDDLRQGCGKGLMATKFHNTVAAAIAQAAMQISARTGIRDVALSGGSFQNLTLLRRTEGILAAAGLTTYINEKMPPNDACISLGQAYLIRERLKRTGGGSA